MSEIRRIQTQDIEALKTVIDTNDLFPSDLLDDMMSDYFNNGSSADRWITKMDNDIPIAIAYYAPEKLTEGTYNLYLIAIHKGHQGMGMGAEIMAYIENNLRECGARILIVETSGLPEFELTRAFYKKCNYNREAVIRDFYKEGEDKVVFWKKLRVS